MSPKNEVGLQDIERIAADKVQYMISTGNRNGITHIGGGAWAPTEQLSKYGCLFIRIRGTKKVYKQKNVGEVAKVIQKIVEEAQKLNNEIKVVMPVQMYRWGESRLG